jgi:hypothetical protein
MSLPVVLSTEPKTHEPWFETKLDGWVEFAQTPPCGRLKNKAVD